MTSRSPAAAVARLRLLTVARQLLSAAAAGWCTRLVERVRKEVVRQPALGCAVSRRARSSRTGCAFDAGPTTKEEPSGPFANGSAVHSPREGVGDSSRSVDVGEGDGKIVKVGEDDGNTVVDGVQHQAAASGCPRSGVCTWTVAALPVCWVSVVLELPIIAPANTEVVLVASLSVVLPTLLVGGPSAVVELSVGDVAKLAPKVEVLLVLTGAACELESGPVAAFAIAISNW